MNRRKREKNYQEGTKNLIEEVKKKLFLKTAKKNSIKVELKIKIN